MDSLPQRPPGATLLTFSRPRSTCRCGAPFTPLRPGHRYCRTCWQWGRIGLLIDATKMQLQKLREVGR